MLHRFAFIGLMVAVLFGTLSSSYAQESSVPVPHPAKALKGEQCVEPAADMRRFHMQYLEHQRDDTMRLGIRGNKYSLRGCVECHATPDEKADGALTVRGFCKECHSYAAVTIDCFSCHTGKAEKQP
ncbi:MAG: Hdr-like menaquinol oxidoreductase cytochrome c subunit [Rhodospirillaceae bacterium]|nr:MAG: Hdr-like menaquinol oxidoreductase cytochrome c subunit [Rhodospirillaceae bacterium]